MIIISGDINLYIRDIIKNIIKPSKGTSLQVAIINSSLYANYNNGILYHIDLTGKIPLDIYICFTNDELEICEDKIKAPFNMDAIKLYLLNIFSNKIFNSTEYAQNLIYINSNMRNIQAFEDIIKAPTSAGKTNFFIGNTSYFITLYSGLFKLSKADTIDMAVYHTFIKDCKLAKFTILKKKIKTKYDLYVFFTS